MPTRLNLRAENQTSRLAWLYLLLSLTLPPETALADAGAVRVSQRRGKRQITVFTDPTPLRAGLVDVSVLVQDAATGSAILNDAIEIAVAPRGNTAATVRYLATSVAASNKLFQAANVDLPDAGWWEFTIDVRGAEDRERVHLEAEAGEALPPWQAMWTWFCWPFLVVAVFALFQFLRPKAEPKSLRRYAGSA